MAGKKTPPTESKGMVISQSMEEVMHASMLPYAEYVILERALPRVEDGLKPVQRRILYTMSELGLTPDKPHKKSARIVGDCLGKFHPHGDTSVYDAMVRMAQPFNMRGMLVDGHGNYGSIDGDGAAAMRYTEARMTQLALELLRDIDENTVDFSLNFDDSLKEPDILPGRFPNLLVNGATGIAVGLATNIPPHNLSEAIDAVIAMIDQPDLPLEDLMRVLPGPDFPTGGMVMGAEGIEEAYRTGRGRILLRAKVAVEELSGGKHQLVITELPYQVNKAAMLEKILKLSEEKKNLLGGISDIRDESDREGMRAVIELRRDTDPERVLQALYKYSDLQVTFGINMVAIAEGRPKQLSLPSIIEHYIVHQKNVVTRRTQFQRDAALARAHILEGLIIAVDHIDQVIRLIRASKSVKEAREGLMVQFELSEIQAQAILDMRLQRLTALMIDELKKEYAQLKKRIEQLESILKSDAKLCALIKKELLEIKTRYPQPRMTRLCGRIEEQQLEESEPASETVVLFGPAGIRRMSPKAYAKREDTEEVFSHVYTTMTNGRLLLFTDIGNVFSLPVDVVPELKWKDRPKALSSLIGLTSGERVVAIFCPILLDFDASDLLFFTRKGMIKRSGMDEYAFKRSGAVLACGLKEGDQLLDVRPMLPGRSLLLVSALGLVIHIDSMDALPRQGRTAQGVRGMTLDPRDCVIAALTVQGPCELIVASDRGYCKRSLLMEYEPQARGGKGQKVFQFHPRGVNGSALVAALIATQPVELVAIQQDGTLTKILSDQLPIEPRASKGVPVIMALMDNVVVEVRYFPIESENNG